MAKQLVNPIERHIEKVIVAVAGLVLLGAIAKYLVTSPNQIELGGEMVTPSTIDARVARKADAIRQRIRDARPQVEKPEPLRGRFEESLATITPMEWRLAVSLRPEAPLVDRAGSKLGQAELVKVIQLPKPTLVSGRSTFESQTEDGDILHSPANWVTVSTLFNVKTQSERQRMAFGAILKDVVYGQLELQRRSQQPDGSWLDKDWKLVDSWPSSPPPDPVAIRLVSEGERYLVTRDNMGRIDRFAKDLTRPETQLDLLRPVLEMAEIVNGTAWSFPFLTTCRDVIMQDDEILFPEDEPSPDPLDRFGLCGGAATAAQPTRELTGAELNAQAFIQAEKMIAEALKTNSENLAIQAFNLLAPIVRGREASNSDKTKARRVLANAEDAQATIARRNMRARRGVTSKADQEDEESPKRERLELQQVWVHDARPDDLMGGNRYQYRIRATLFNRLAGQPSKFADAIDATQIYIAGDWSEPSDPILIPPDVEFFVTGGNKKDEETKVEMYQWYDGVWIKARSQKFSIGDRIAMESKKVKVPSLTQVGGTDRIDVVFDTGAVVLDIDFTRQLRERKRARGSVKFGGMDEVVSVTLVDDRGMLHERFVPVEKAHPGKRAVANRVYKP